MKRRKRLEITMIRKRVSLIDDTVGPALEPQRLDRMLDSDLSLRPIDEEDLSFLDEVIGILRTRSRSPDEVDDISETSW